MYKFSQRSLINLASCHEDLQKLANAVITIHDCTVVFGHRSKEDQDYAYNHGYSKLQYPYSKHNKYPSYAIDLLPYKNGSVSWNREDVLYFAGIVNGVLVMLQQNKIITSAIRWGGSWNINPGHDFKKNTFFDGGHWEIVS